MKATSKLSNKATVIKSAAPTIFSAVGGSLSKRGNIAETKTIQLIKAPFNAKNVLEYSSGNKKVKLRIKAYIPLALEISCKKGKMRSIPK
jgi:hypothetical protein